MLSSLIWDLFIVDLPHESVYMCNLNRSNIAIKRQLVVATKVKATQTADTVQVVATSPVTRDVIVQLMAWPTGPVGRVRIKSTKPAFRDWGGFQWHGRSAASGIGVQVATMAGTLGPPWASSGRAGQRAVSSQRGG
jgi:hypothetical protein